MKRPTKTPQRPKPETKKPPGESHDVYAAREASKREVGDIADKITRAPKKR